MDDTSLFWTLLICFLNFYFSWFGELWDPHRVPGFVSNWKQYMFLYIQCCRSVSFWYESGSGSCSKSNLKSGKYQLLFNFFFYKKNIFLRNKICFVIFGVNIYVSKHKFNSYEKRNVWYSNDLGWFLWKFSMI